jgi:signal transduction histidine kinase
MIRRDVATGVTRWSGSATFLDWLPVAVVPPILIVDAAISRDGGPITIVSVLAAFAGCLPLAARRRVPIAVMFPLVTAGIILVLWQLHPPNTVVIIAMIALFELALSGDRRRSLMMSVATVPCVIVSILPFHAGDSLASLVIRNLALCLLAIAAGDIVRSRKLSAQRNLEAMEQETLRRVGEERLQIAREIHDLVAHAMTAINVQAGVAAHLLEREPRQAYDALRNIKHTSGAALSDLRSTLDVLRDPSAAAPLGPPARFADIPELTNGLRAAGMTVDLDVEAGAEVPVAVQSAGYRIVQESLTNVARHASGASSAHVSVRRMPGAVRIEVIDDGAGTSVPPNGAAGGNGIRGMRERVAALGGTLEAAPIDTGGWRVRATLPTGGGGGAPNGTHEPAGTGEPARTGAPARTGEPARTGALTGTGEPARTGEPAGTGEPARIGALAGTDAPDANGTRT